MASTVVGGAQRAERSRQVVRTVADRADGAASRLPPRPTRIGGYGPGEFRETSQTTAKRSLDDRSALTLMRCRHTPTQAERNSRKGDGENHTAQQPGADGEGCDQEGRKGPLCRGASFSQANAKYYQGEGWRDVKASGRGPVMSEQVPERPHLPRIVEKVLQQPRTHFRHRWGNALRENSDGEDGNPDAKRQQCGELPTKLRPGARKTAAAANPSPDNIATENCGSE